MLSFLMSFKKIGIIQDKKPLNETQIHSSACINIANDIDKFGSIENGARESAAK